MTSARKTRGGAGIVETEIERAREEGHWKRVVELADSWRQRPDQRQFDTLANFLIGEAKLEEFLEEYPPKEKNTHKAKEGLQEAKEYLMKTIGDEAKKLGKTLIRRQIKSSNFKFNSSTTLREPVSHGSFSLVRLMYCPESVRSISMTV